MTADERVGERLRDDRSNVTAAFDWLASNEQWVRAGELLLGGLAVYETGGQGVEATSLFERCEGPLDAVDVELADLLRAAMTFTLILTAEFATLVRVARRLRESDVPACRVTGSGSLAFTSAFTAPEQVRRHLDRAHHDYAIACEEQPGLNTDICRPMLGTIEALVSIMSGEYEAALDSFRRLDDLDLGGHVSQHDLNRHYVAAGLHLLIGEPSVTLEELERLDGHSFAYEIEGFRALAHLMMGNLDVARELIRLHAAESLTGRLSM
jgi:hypothetical protein